MSNLQKNDDNAAAKPCPFCGSRHDELICSGSAWFVRCNECGATGPEVMDGEDRDSQRAIEAWNRLSGMRALLVLIDQEYGLSGSWVGNGCEHGFKPAASCPNAGCRVAQIQREWDRVVPQNRDS